MTSSPAISSSAFRPGEAVLHGNYLFTMCKYCSSISSEYIGKGLNNNITTNCVSCTKGEKTRQEREENNARLIREQTQKQEEKATQAKREESQKRYLEFSERLFKILAHKEIDGILVPVLSDIAKGYLGV